MIDTAATFYSETNQWALAVHRDFPDFDGLIWTSHLHDRDTACVFFGDRVLDTDFVIQQAQPIDVGAGEARMTSFATAYGIDLTL